MVIICQLFSLIENIYLDFLPFLNTEEVQKVKFLEGKDFNST